MYTLFFFFFPNFIYFFNLLDSTSLQAGSTVPLHHHHHLHPHPNPVDSRTSLATYANPLAECAYNNAAIQTQVCKTHKCLKQYFSFRQINNQIKVIKTKGLFINVLKKDYFFIYLFTFNILKNSFL